MRGLLLQDDVPPGRRFNFMASELQVDVSPSRKYSSQRLELREVVGFTLPTPNNHTMSYALIEYCFKRLPMQQWMQLRQHNIPLELHAVPFQFLERRHQEFGFDWVERLVWRPHGLRKPYNYIRPELVLARRVTGEYVALLTVMPGSDYVRHYAAIMEVAYNASGFDNDGVGITCVIYPELTSTITSWTGLTDVSAAVQPGDVIIIGFVVELLALFRAKIPTSKILSQHDSTYYGLVRLQLNPSLVLTFLGVKYSYWGNLGGLVAGHLALRRPRAICYVAKQGTLLSPSHIHHELYSPTRYVVFDGGAPVWSSASHPSTSPPNPISSLYPSYDRGPHVSLPTIVEQSLPLRSTLQSHGIASIDNELSQIARSLAAFHESHPALPGIQLLPLMFVTDYLRRPSELELVTPFDLTSRNPRVSSNKARFLGRAGNLVLEAFGVNPGAKAAVVGTGFGVKTILPALKRRGVRVVGLNGGRDGERTRRVAGEEGIGGVDESVEALREGRGANLFFVASPHGTHGGILRGILGLREDDGGGAVDVVCEKPLALSFGEMDELISRAKGRKGLGLVDHQLRFYPPFLHFKRAVLAVAATEARDALAGIEIVYLTRRLREIGAWNADVFSKAKGGGMLLAMGTHFLDLIEWFAESEVEEERLEELETWNTIGSLPVREDRTGGRDVEVEGQPCASLRTIETMMQPEVESGFRMRGTIEKAKAEEREGQNATTVKDVRYTIHCDGAADDELFHVILWTRSGRGWKFEHRKRHPVTLEGRSGETDVWSPLKEVRLEERILMGSPWQVAFQSFVEELAEAIHGDDRERFASKATGFEAYRRQVGLFGRRAGIL